MDKDLVGARGLFQGTIPLFTRREGRKYKRILCQDRW